MDVNSWCCGENGEEVCEIPPGRPKHMPMIIYFEEMLGIAVGEDFYFFTINSTAFGEIYIMSPEDIVKYKLARE